MTVKVDQLTKEYIELRDEKRVLGAEFKEADKAVTEKMDAIKFQLLQHCKDNNVDSVRTSEGLFYRSVKQRYWTSDWEAMHQFVLQNEVPEFFEKRLNQTVLKQFLEENPDVLPPGLNVDSEYVVSVRK